jgi:hypothetical protein
MPNYGTLVLGPPDIRRIFAGYSFAEYSPLPNVPRDP